MILRWFWLALFASRVASCREHLPHEHAARPRPPGANADASPVASGGATSLGAASPAAPAAVLASSASTARAPGACPGGMKLVTGAYCTEVRQTCLRWMDKDGPYQYYRCAQYRNPSQCVGKRVAKRFCVDREEYAAPGDPLPLANQSWTSAESLCKSRGARLCLEDEWQFACEGEDMHPYPYGDGFHRDKHACNIDQMHLGRANENLTDLRAPTADYPNCLSPFGIHNMSGNVEEWATLEGGRAPNRSTMKGAWWLPGKNTCRAATLGHGEVYKGKQVGIRCCADAGAEP